jgi:ABC-type phosphate/phosphonate transport system substrate-binding protein
MAALAKSLVDAAGVTPRFAMPYARMHGLRMHVIYRSAPFPQIPLLVHKTRVPAGLATRIRTVLLGMAQDEEGKALLKSLAIPPFQPADDALYASTREVYSRWGQRAAAAGSR